MAAKKVISSVGQRWQRPLALEMLEDRCVPSTSGTLASLAVTLRETMDTYLPAISKPGHWRRTPLFTTLSNRVLP